MSMGPPPPRRGDQPRGAPLRRQGREPMALGAGQGQSSSGGGLGGAGPAAGSSPTSNGSASGERQRGIGARDGIQPAAWAGADAGSAGSPPYDSGGPRGGDWRGPGHSVASSQGEGTPLSSRQNSRHHDGIHSQDLAVEQLSIASTLPGLHAADEAAAAAAAFAAAAAKSLPVSRETSTPTPTSSTEAMLKEALAMVQGSVGEMREGLREAVSQLHAAVEALGTRMGNAEADINSMRRQVERGQDQTLERLAEVTESIGHFQNAMSSCRDEIRDSKGDIEYYREMMSKTINSHSESTVNQLMQEVTRLTKEVKESSDFEHHVANVLNKLQSDGRLHGELIRDSRERLTHLEAQVLGLHNSLRETTNDVILLRQGSLGLGAMQSADLSMVLQQGSLGATQNADISMVLLQQGPLSQDAMSGQQGPLSMGEGPLSQGLLSGAPNSEIASNADMGIARVGSKEIGSRMASSKAASLVDECMRPHEAREIQSHAAAQYEAEGSVTAVSITARPPTPGAMSTSRAPSHASLHEPRESSSHAPPLQLPIPSVHHLANQSAVAQQNSSAAVSAVVTATPLPSARESAVEVQQLSAPSVPTVITHSGTSVASVIAPATASSLPSARIVEFPQSSDSLAPRLATVTSATLPGTVTPALPSARTVSTAAAEVVVERSAVVGPLVDSAEASAIIRQAASGEFSAASNRAPSVPRRVEQRVVATVALDEWAPPVSPSTAARVIESTSSGPKPIGLDRETGLPVYAEQPKEVSSPSGSVPPNATVMQMSAQAQAQSDSQLGTQAQTYPAHPAFAWKAGPPQSISQSDGVSSVNEHVATKAPGANSNAGKFLTAPNNSNVQSASPARMPHRPPASPMLTSRGTPMMPGAPGPGRSPSPSRARAMGTAPTEMSSMATSPLAQQSPRRGPTPGRHVPSYQQSVSGERMVGSAPVSANSVTAAPPPITGSTGPPRQMIAAPDSARHLAGQPDSARLAAPPPRSGYPTPSSPTQPPPAPLAPPQASAELAQVAAQLPMSGYPTPSVPSQPVVAQPPQAPAQLPQAPAPPPQVAAQLPQVQLPQGMPWPGQQPPAYPPQSPTYGQAGFQAQAMQLQMGMMAQAEATQGWSSASGMISQVMSPGPHMETSLSFPSAILADSGPSDAEAIAAAIHAAAWQGVAVGDGTSVPGAPAPAAAAAAAFAARCDVSPSQSESPSPKKQKPFGSPRAGKMGSRPGSPAAAPVSFGQRLAQGPSQRSSPRLRNGPSDAA